MKNNRLLFGGALMAAGLAAQSAGADFTFSYTNTRVAAFDYAGDNFGFEDIFSGAGTWSISVDDGPNSVATSEGTALAIRLNATTTVDGSAYTNFFSLFTVTSDATADVSWDFNAGYFGVGFVYLLNVTDFIVLVFEQDTGAGTTTVSLEAGKEYSAQGTAFSYDLNAGAGSGPPRHCTELHESACKSKGDISANPTHRL